MIHDLSLNLVPVLYLFILMFSLALVITDQNETDKEWQAHQCFKSWISDPVGALLSSWGNTYLQFCNWHGVICGAVSPQYTTSLNFLWNVSLTLQLPPFQIYIIWNGGVCVCIYIYIHTHTTLQGLRTSTKWLDGLRLTTHRVNITGKSINSRFIDSHSHYFTVLQLNNTQKLLYEI